MALPAPTPAVGFALWVVVWGSSLLSVGLWVSRDATARGSDQPKTWGILAILAGPIALPYYFYLRSRGTRISSRRVPPTAVDRALATWASAGVVAIAVGSLFAPPDPITMSLYAAGVLVVVLPAAYLLVYRGGYRRVAAA